MVIFEPDSARVALKRKRKMQTYSVISGPSDCGNVFGFFKSDLIPAERWAVVTSGEYANGGHGPSLAEGVVYRSLESAERRAAELEAAKEN